MRGVGIGDDVVSGAIPGISGAAGEAGVLVVLRPVSLPVEVLPGPFVPLYEEPSASSGTGGLEAPGDGSGEALGSAGWLINRGVISRCGCDTGVALKTRRERGSTK